jgi:hypothetical protein
MSRAQEPQKSSVAGWIARSMPALGYKPSFVQRVDIHARQDFEFAVQPDLLRHLVKLMMTGGLPELIVAEVASGRELGIPLAVPAHSQAASA